MRFNRNFIRYIITMASQGVIKMKFFCNICTVRIGKDKVTSFITSCRHIFCEKCYTAAIAANGKQCPKCQRRDHSVVPIDRNMPPNLMEYFYTPDAKLEKSIDVALFQRDQMQPEKILRMLQIGERWKLLKAEWTKNNLIAEWNQLYVDKINEYRKEMRSSYKYDDIVCNNKLVQNLFDLLNIFQTRGVVNEWMR